MSSSIRVLGATSVAAALVASLWVLKSVASPSDAGSIERGRYLVRVAGCNDCHTPGYAETGGAVPESQWLVGNSVGWRGGWGTTYPSNLRLYMQRVTEDQWITVAREQQMRPPMPWFNLRDMSEQDLRALYRFVRHLGPAGEPAPSYVPPHEAPQGPAIQFPDAPN
ncbi:MAG: cytochrome C [Steroidobacteraceae bacterium]|nr:cytochrome C [Steroidobacteraceae bacterium]